MAEEVGFEPTHVAILEPESSPLDRSGTLAIKLFLLFTIKYSMNNLIFTIIIIILLLYY